MREGFIHEFRITHLILASRLDEKYNIHHDRAFELSLSTKSGVEGLRRWSHNGNIKTAGKQIIIE
jgi:predicted aminopeptidase